MVLWTPKRLMAAWNINFAQNVVYDYAQITTSYQDIQESRHNRNYQDINLNHRLEKVKVGGLNYDMWKKIKSIEMGLGVEVTYNKVNSTAYVENILTLSTTSLDTRYPDGEQYSNLCRIFYTFK